MLKTCLWLTSTLMACAGAIAACPAAVPLVPALIYPSQPASAAASGVDLPILRSNDAGYLLYWYGPAKANGARPLSWATLEADKASVSYFAQLLAAYAASGDASALIAASATKDSNAPEQRAIWCPFYDEMVTGMHLPPPSVAYVVSKNGTTPTRPAYQVTNGVIGTKEAARAPVGEACLCDGHSVLKGTTTYCPYGGGPSYAVVTACVKSGP